MKRVKMDQARRAKQFMPFAALKGYEEALRKKEKRVVDKIQLSLEAKEEINRKLQWIEKNDVVTLIYFNQEDYVEVTGVVSKIDKESKFLKIVDQRIEMKDIVNVEIEKFKNVLE